MILSSVSAMTLLVFAQLCPAKWKPRTGLGGPVDHFLAYFAVTSIVCFAWPKRFMVGATLMVASGLLEWLQRFTPDRKPNIRAALCGVGGTLLAAILRVSFGF
jgi:VanZ family protein